MEKKNTCEACEIKVEEWNERCKGCGFTLILEPKEKIKARYLRTPSLGALFFTQGWTFGARLYLLFVLSLIPIVGIAVLLLCVVFGRRWSWKYGAWSDWQTFNKRMKLLDVLAIAWIIGLILIWLYARSVLG